jgi:hypothetical protein
MVFQVRIFHTFALERLLLACENCKSEIAGIFINVGPFNLFERQNKMNKRFGACEF